MNNRKPSSTYETIFQCFSCRAHTRYGEFDSLDRFRCNSCHNVKRREESERQKREEEQKQTNSDKQK